MDLPLRIPAEHRAEALVWRDVGHSGDPAPGRAVRYLDELRRPLPLDDAAVAGAGAWTFRPYRPRVDDAGILATNNRAFDWHPDQGGWDEARFAERTAADWFRPEDLLVHEGADGAVDGFCWTRFHPAEGPEPALGEIHVIATDPRTQQRGLGRALVVAGLEHQVQRGATVAMLFVERDNLPAQRLYASMGFTLHRRRAGHLGPTGDARR